MYRLVSGPNAKLSDLAKFDINEVAMKPYFIPDTTSLDDQMRQFCVVARILRWWWMNTDR
jgi:Mg2+/Co2+ transporter CorB